MIRTPLLRLCSFHLDINLCQSFSEAPLTSHHASNPLVSYFKTQFPIVYRHISGTHTSQLRLIDSEPISSELRPTLITLKYKNNVTLPKQKNMS